MSGESKTPIAFRNACDDFIFTEVLRTPDAEKDAGLQSFTEQLNGPVTKRDVRSDTKLVNILTNAFNEYADAEGWTLLASSGGLIKRQYPDFDPSLGSYTQASSSNGLSPVWASMGSIREGNASG